MLTGQLLLLRRLGRLSLLLRTLTLLLLVSMLIVGQRAGLLRLWQTLWAPVLLW